MKTDHVKVKMSTVAQVMRGCSNMILLISILVLLNVFVANAEDTDSIVSRNIAKRGFTYSDLILLVDNVYIIKESVKTYRLPQTEMDNYTFLLFYATDNKITPNDINCFLKKSSTPTLTGPVYNAAMTALCNR